MSNNTVWEPGAADPFPSSVSPAGNENGMLQTLRTLIAQLEATNARLGEIKGKIKGIECRLHKIDGFDVLEHNKRAREVNRKADGVMSGLVPLYDSKARPVPGFPVTVGELAQLFGTPNLKRICDSFGLKREDLSTLVEFIGANYNTVISALEYFTPRQERDRSRSMRQLVHAHHLKNRRPPTAEIQAIIAEKNKEAREHNAKAKGEHYGLMPLRTASGMSVNGFPKTVGELANIGPKSEITYLLEAYGQSVDGDDYRKRFIEFTGVPYCEVWMHERVGLGAFKWADE